MHLWLTRRWRPLLALALLIVLPLLLLGHIAEELHEHEVFGWEAPLMVAFRYDAPTGFRWVADVFSTVGSARVMLPFSAVLLLILWRRSHTMARYFLLSVGGAVLLNVLLKALFNRERPQVIPWLWEENDASFPSGHSSMAAALMVTLTALLWRTRWRWPVGMFGALYILLMGVSRVYLGVHYPTDVLGGWALGLAWAGGVALMAWRGLQRARDHAARTGPVPDPTDPADPEELEAQAAQAAGRELERETP